MQSQVARSQTESLLILLSASTADRRKAMQERGNNSRDESRMDATR